MISVMKKTKIIAGIAWAFAGLILMIIFFPFWGNFSYSIGKLPFMKINPNYTGGEIAMKYVTENCTLVVHKPVFNGLLKERKSGFVQVDWRGKLPDIFTDTIDYTLDKTPDFIVRVDKSSSKTDLTALNGKVKDVRISTPASYGWAVRVNLNKE
jgi:hypothetical protein